MDDHTPSELDRLTIRHQSDLQRMWELLITRPGRNGTTAFDRELSHRLLTGARAAAITTHPVHVADDVAVRAITPDDLAA